MNRVTDEELLQVAKTLDKLNFDQLQALIDQCELYKLKFIKTQFKNNEGILAKFTMSKQENK